MIPDAEERKDTSIHILHLPSSPHELKDDPLFEDGYECYLAAASPQIGGSLGYHRRENFVILEGELTIGEKLSDGHFSEVRKGQYRGKLIAIKKLKKAETRQDVLQEPYGFYVEDKDSSDYCDPDLEYEAARLSVLSHPNVVDFYGIYKEEQDYSIVMEFCGGGTLLSALPKLTAWRQKYRLALDIIQGLAYLHSQGIVHRDLKTANILLDKHGRAKLTDLGLAQTDVLLQAADFVQEDKTSVVQYIGDIPWSSPEECRAYIEFKKAHLAKELSTSAQQKIIQTASTQESDIYSFGMILWQMVSGLAEPYSRKDIHGRIVSSRKHYSFDKILNKIANGKHETIPKSCPPQIQELILSCWKAPKERPSALALVSRLENLAEIFDPDHDAILKITQRMDGLVHSGRKELDYYIPPYVSSTEIDQDLDGFWLREEQKIESKDQDEKTEGKEEKSIEQEITRLHFLVDDFLNQRSRSLVIFGDAGVGKTLAVYQTADRLFLRVHNQIIQSESGGHRSYLPIFIKPAFSVWSQSSLENGIDKALRSSIYQLNTAAIEKLKNYPVLFILDGYDELSFGGLDQEKRNIGELLGFSNWPYAKLLTVARPHVVARVEESKVFGISGDYQKCYLLPFRIDQVFEYLRNHHIEAKAIEDCRIKLKEADQLRSTLRNPFVLSLFTRSFSRIIKQDFKTLTRYKIYQCFIEYWIEQNQKQLMPEVQRRLQDEEETLLESYDRFTGLAAHYFFQRNIFKGDLTKLKSSWTVLDHIVEQGAKTAFRNRDPSKSRRISEHDFINLMKTKYQRFISLAPLRQRAEGFGFMHKSFYEYFVLRNILNHIKSSEALLDILNKRSLQEEPEIFKFFQEHWEYQSIQDRNYLKKQLFETVYASRGNSKVSQASSNAITLLSMVRIPFSGMDLRGLDIAGADLDRALMHKTKLTDSNLTNVSFRKAHLQEACMDRAIMRGVRFGELAHLSAGTGVNSIAFLPSNPQFVALGCDNGTIRLQHYKTGELLNVLGLGEIQTTAISPNDKLLAIGSDDGLIRLYDISNPYCIEALKPLCGHTHSVTSVAFSEDGLLLASGSGDHTVRLWDIKDPKNAKSFPPLCGHTSWVHTVAFRGDGLLLASGSGDHTVRLWDIRDPKNARSFPPLCGHAGWVNSVTFRRDGLLLASGSEDHTIRLWDIQNPKKVKAFSVLCGHTYGVTSVIFRGDGLLLASGSRDHTIRFWAVENPENVKAFKLLCEHTDSVTSVAFGKDGLLFASGSRDHTVMLWDTRNLKEVKALKPLCRHASDVTSVVFGKNGLLLISGSKDHTVKLWDIQNPEEAQALKVFEPFYGHTSSVTSVIFRRDGLLLVSGSSDHTIRLWDVENLENIKAFEPLYGHMDSVYAVTISEDGLLLASGSRDHTVRLWDVKDPKNVKSFPPLCGHTGWVNSVAFGRDALLLASGSGDRTIRLWGVKNPKNVEVFKPLYGHTSSVSSVTFRRDGLLLVSGSGDYTVRLWDTKDLKNVKAFPPLCGHTNWVHSVTFGGSGLLLASGSEDKTIRLWGVKSPENVKTFKLLCGHTDRVTAITFRGDEQLLASGSGDRTVKLWDVKDPKDIKALPLLRGHTSDVTSITFREDGLLLISGSLDYTVRLWDIKDPENVKMFPSLCRHANYVTSVAFRGDGLLFASGGHDKMVRLWDAEDPKNVKAFPPLCGHTSGVTSVIFRKDGLLLASGSLDHTIRLWDVKDPKNVKAFPPLFGHIFGVTSVVFGRDGQLLASGSLDHTVKLWDVENPKNVKLFPPLYGHTSAVASVVFRRDGFLLASGSGDHTVRLWDVKNPGNVKTFPPLCGHTSGVTSIVFRSDGLLLASGSLDHTVRLWNVKNPENVKAFPPLYGHTSSVTSVIFRRDGFLLASGSGDRTIRLWDVKNPENAFLVCSLPDLADIQGLCLLNLSVRYSKYLSKGNIILLKQRGALNIPEIVAVKEDQDEKEEARSVESISQSKYSLFAAERSKKPIEEQKYKLHHEKERTGPSGW